jgi:transposase-like protein
VDKKPSLAFYDFHPAHKQHIRTPNPIDSTFAKDPLKTAKIHECDARRTILTMVSQPGMSAEKKWQKRKRLKCLPRYSGKSNSTEPSLKGYPRSRLAYNSSQS